MGAGEGPGTMPPPEHMQGQVVATPATLQFATPHPAHAAGLLSGTVHPEGGRGLGEGIGAGEGLRVGMGEGAGPLPVVMAMSAQLLQGERE
jgi:hypothetical protein